MKVMEKTFNNKQLSANQFNNRVDEAAKGMEKLFLKHLVNELRKSNENIDVFGEKRENDFFENELYNEYVDKAVDRGDMGIAKMIKEYIKRTNGL